MLVWSFNIAALLLPVFAVRVSAIGLIAGYIVIAMGAEAYLSAASVSAALLLRGLIRNSFSVRTSTEESRGLLFAGLLLLLLCLSMIIHIDQLREGRYVSESFQYIFALGLMLVVLLGLNDQSDRRVLITGLMAAAALLAAAKVVQLFGLTIGDTNAPLRNGPDNTASIIILLGGCCPVLARARIFRPATMALLALFAAGIWLNESRASLLAFLLLLFWRLVFLSRRGWAYFVLTLIVVGAYVTFWVDVGTLSDPLSIATLFDFDRNYSNRERLGLLLHSYNSFLDAPLGHAVGSSSRLFPDSPYTVGEYPHAHNTLAHFAVEFGVIGLAMYAALVLFMVASYFTVDTGVGPGRTPAQQTGEIHTPMLIKLWAMSIVLVSLYEAMTFNGVLTSIVFVILGAVLAGDRSVRYWIVLGPPPGAAPRIGDAEGSRPAGAARPRVGQP